MHCNAHVDDSGRMIIELPQQTPSLNKLLRQHRFARSKQKADWIKLLAIAVGPKRSESQKMRVTIERHGPRVLDDDNLRGGAKVLIDALRAHGLIVDDSPKWMMLEARCVRAKSADARTRIVLEEFIEHVR